MHLKRKREQTMKATTGTINTNRETQLDKLILPCVLISLVCVAFLAVQSSIDSLASLIALLGFMHALRA